MGWGLHGSRVEPYVGALERCRCRALEVWVHRCREGAFGGGWRPRAHTYADVPEEDFNEGYRAKLAKWLYGSMAGG